MILSHSAWLSPTRPLPARSDPGRDRRCRLRRWGRLGQRGATREGSRRDRRLSHGRSSAESCSYRPPFTSLTLVHPGVLTPTLLIAIRPHPLSRSRDSSSSPPVPLSAYAERGDDERASRSKDLGDLSLVPP